MKITQDEVVDNQTTLHIELEDDDLGPYLDRGYQSISQQIVIPGFRKGKAPRRVVEGFVGRESLLNEVLDTMIFEVVGKAIEEQELDSVGLPRIDELELEPVNFRAVVPLRPDIDLGDYESIRVDFEEPEVTDEQVTARIDAIRQSLGTWEPVDRPAQFEDLTVIDLRSDVDGQNPWTADDQTFFLAEEGRFPLPGFSAQLVDLEIGLPKEFTLEVPEDFQDDSLAGKQASFTVTVKEVSERVLPELNDEFAQGLPDGYEDLNALTTAVREALAADAEAQGESEYRNNVLETLIEATSMTIPPVVLETETERIQEDQLRYLANANIRLDDFLTSIGKTEEENEKESEEQAEQRIRRNLVIARLADVEGIEATEQEIDERYNQMYAGQRMRRQERRSRRDSLAEMIKFEKTLDALVSIAKGERDNADAAPTTDTDVSDSEGDQEEDDSQP